VPNLVIAPVGADGRVDIWNLAGKVQIIADAARPTFGCHVSTHWVNIVGSCVGVVGRDETRVGKRGRTRS
jgi:hypothetical protein